MALMLGSLYDALITANVPGDKARKAAEEAAAYENRLTTMAGEIGDVKADLRLLKWMVGFNTALTVAVLTLILRGMVA
jgi:hypothetical protein